MTPAPSLRSRDPRLLPLAVALGLALAACGSSPSGSGHELDGTPYSPPKPAPPLALRDSLGQHVDLRQYRGKAVLETFIYTHCPDICPTIVGNLHTTQSLLGTKARRLQVIAVSVDPRGDTPKAVSAFLSSIR